MGFWDDKIERVSLSKDPEVWADVTIDMPWDEFNEVQKHLLSGSSDDLTKDSEAITNANIAILKAAIVDWNIPTKDGSGVLPHDADNIEASLRSLPSSAILKLLAVASKTFTGRTEEEEAKFPVKA